jgi:mono/diheme cytochrome c family protein
MRRVLTWVGIVIGGLLGLIVLAVVGIYVVSGARLGRTYAIQPAPVAIPTDQASLVRGQHLAVAIGKCVDCHGPNLGGRLFLDAGPVGVVRAPNLTRGQGSAVNGFSDADWVRAIRHGVGQDGRGLLIMPADEYYYFSDADLGALIAYVKSVPPVDNQVARSEIGPLGHLLHVTGQLRLMAAETIAHTGPRPAAPPAGPTAAYGAYLAQTGGCVGCHGPGLSGGRVPGTPPEIPPATNLTPGGAMQGWSEDDFKRALRTGRRPDGREIDRFMPWIATGQMTDEEIRAVWLYLQSVPPRPAGTR